MKWPTLRWPAIAPASPKAPATPLKVRLLWMVALWAGSVLSLLAFASLVRLVLRH